MGKGTQKLALLTVCLLLVSFLFSPVLFPVEEQSPSSHDQSRLPIVPGAVILFGLLFLCMGWKLYKFLISVTGLVLGLFLAYLIGKYFPNTPSVTQYIIVAAFGIVGFIFAFPFQKSIIFFLGGMGGSVLLSNPVYIITAGKENQTLWVLGSIIIGFFLFGILSFYFFKLIIIVSTSLIGSFAFLLGIYNIFSKLDVSSSIVRWMDPSDKGFFLLLLFTFFGILIQLGINKVYPDKEEKGPKKEPQKEPEELKKEQEKE